MSKVKKKKLIVIITSDSESVSFILESMAYRYTGMVLEQ